MSAILIIGGCRSGKSDQALALAANCPGRRKVFIATCIPRDAEMRKRVSDHQIRRGSDWLTVETGTDLLAALEKHASADVVIVDCLTLWVSNLMETGLDDDSLLERAGEVARFVRETTCAVFLVTNEVGCGIVPENALARRFRDLAGAVNRVMAEACPQVVWMVAGIPVTIKNQA